MANIITRNKGTFIRGGVRRRETFWMQIAQVSTNLTVSAAAFLTNFLTSAALAVRPFTIVRTRIKWLVTSDQVAATEAFIGNVGISVVSDQAIAIGVTAVPTPAIDLGSDLFFLIDQWPGRFELVAGLTALSDLAPMTIDSKAMRKVDDDQNVAMVAEAGIGGDGLNISTVGRMLIKLH